MNEYDTIRPDIRAALDRYATQHMPVGQFLQAIIANDLTEAVCRADDGNLATIRAIVHYVYNELPSPCHGSRGAYHEWIHQE